MPHTQLAISQRLSEVRYEIRGELARRALELEAQGREILKLNIGNPVLFGFRTPDHLRAAVAANLESSEGYCHQQGMLDPREAIAAQQRRRGVVGMTPAQVFIGNGVSELIDLSLRALLNNGDEVLVPSPDYPLWSAAVLLNDGRPVHYDCRPENAFLPDPDQIESLITPRTRALVLINPNNPTGAVYPRELLLQLVRVAERHRLVLMVDEIYDEVLYDQAAFVPLAPLAQSAVCLTFSGLSKVHRACGYRIGWMTLSGDLMRAGAYHHALDLLAALRLCSNVAGQWAVRAALEGPASITALTAPGGRLYESRRAAIEACNKSAFLSMVAPAGALYGFPGVDRELLPEFDDHRFALELLETENVLVVPGSSFNVTYRNHFRITLLPEAATIREVFTRIERLLERRVESAQPERHVA